MIKRNYYKLGIIPMILVSILVASMLGMTMLATAADWPMFRNDASNTGNSLETINLSLTEQWHSNAPSVEENGAVASKGIVYMVSNSYHTGNSSDNKLYAFNVSTGLDVPGFPVQIGLSVGSPAVDSQNAKVYVLTNNGLEVFNFDGTSAWTASVGSIGRTYNEGPIIDAGYVYVKAGGNLQKYNSGGVLQWSAPTSGSNTQPSIMGGYVYINSESGQIRKYNKTTGTEITTGGFPISTASDQSALATINGKIFYKADILYAYNASNGSLIWSQPDGGDSTYSDSPAVSNGVVYIYGWDGKIYAFDENTGTAIFGFPSVSLDPSGGRNWNSPAIAGDKIFIGAGTTQNLTVLGAAGSASAGQVLAQYKTFSSDPQGFDLCSPIISDGVVFAMLDGGGLYAFFSSGTIWTGGAIKINNGASCTSSQNVTLELDRGSNTLVNQMRISENPLFTGAVWEPYNTTKAWTLSPGFGTKTVYVQYKDSNGQLSNVFNAKIEYSENCGGNIRFNISGYKINDTNGDGLWNAGESGIAGWNITLKNASTGAFIASNFTDATGFYQFTNLTNGSYNVTEETRAGWVNTNATFKVITISGQNVVNQNFTNKRVTVPTGSSISGMKFNDLNGNGRRDAGEPGLANWTIKLVAGGNLTGRVVNRTAVTDANGNYAFTNLTPGRYNVFEYNKPKWNPTTPWSVRIILGANQSIVVDFGNKQVLP